MCSASRVPRAFDARESRASDGLALFLTPLPSLRKVLRCGTWTKMSGGNGEGPAKKRQSVGAAIARLAGETSDNMKKPNDGKKSQHLVISRKRLAKFPSA